MSDIEKIQEILLLVAKDYSRQGPGFAQGPVVLHEAAQRLKISRDVGAQQRLLNVWQDLFRTGKLYWGYDLQNPDQPFFHFPDDALANTDAR